VLQEPGTIGECEEHGWMLDRGDPDARERALLVARQDPPLGVSPKEAVAAIEDVLGSIGETLEKSPFLERIWNIIIHMSATNIGGSLYLERKRRKLIIVNNRTDVAFITGDQPVINLKGARPAPADRLSIFYPIAPNAALLMADFDEEPLFPAEGLTRDQAATLNRMLFQASYKQVFGLSAECLRAIALTSRQ
jgi:hypothetical protein